MDTFLKLNRRKLMPMLVRTSLVFFGAVLIPLTITLINGSVPNVKFVLIVLTIACFGFPLLILFFGLLIWQFNHKTKQKVLSKTPFNQVDQIGFYKSYISDTSKWSLADEIWEGKINGFAIKKDISKEKRHRFIEFDFQVEWKKLDSRKYNRLAEEFKQYKAEFKIGSIAKLYDTRQKTLQSVIDLQQDLELFTTLLRQEGFEPENE